jgi:hypothetical protein
MYAKEIRNTGDLGVVAQLNAQHYQVIRQYLAELSFDRTAYAAIDTSSRQITPVIISDLGKADPWPYRDGKVKTSRLEADGAPGLRLELGGDSTPYNSVFVRGEAVDLAATPYLDFMVRTTSTESLSIMFQVDGGGSEWYSIELIGKQPLHRPVAFLPTGSISDGNWHRVTWDLRRLVREQIGEQYTHIRNVIMGSWGNPVQPVVVDFRDFRFGAR